MNARPLTTPVSPSIPSQFEHRHENSVVVALWSGALCFLLLLPCLWFPIGKDASVFLLGGRILHGGGMLYRDLWDIKPPLIYLLAALPAALPSSWQVVGFYLLASLAAAANVFFCAQVITPVIGKRVALAIAPVFAAVTLFPATTSLGQCESWANLLGWAAIWCLVGRTSKGFAFAAGLLLGALPFLKVTSLLPLLPFLLLASSPSKRWLWLAGGFIGAIGLGMGAMRVLGVWPYYADIIHNFLAIYVTLGGGPVIPRLIWFTSNLAIWAACVGGFSLFCAAGLIDRTLWIPRWKRVILASFLLGIVAMWLQSRNVVYQWTVLLPPFALLSATGVVALSNMAGPKAAKFLAPVLLMAICLITTRDIWISFVLHPSIQSQEAVLKNRDLVGEKWHDQRAVAAYVRSQAQPNDSLWVWGFEPALYLVGPRPANRFVYTAPLCATFAPLSWKTEAWNSLRSQPPRFIVVQSHLLMDDLGAPDRDAEQLWRETSVFPWFMNHYTLEKQIGAYKIYSRKIAFALAP